MYCVLFCIYILGIHIMFKRAFHYGLSREGYHAGLNRSAHKSVCDFTAENVQWNTNKRYSGTITNSTVEHSQTVLYYVSDI